MKLDMGKVSNFEAYREQIRHTDMSQDRRSPLKMQIRNGKLVGQPLSDALTIFKDYKLNAAVRMTGERMSHREQ